MALRSAGLSGFDIDASECYAFGGFLADAVEASSVMRVLPGKRRGVSSRVALSWRSIGGRPGAAQGSARGSEI